MPLVVVARNPHVIKDDLLSVITQSLPFIVANALNCEDEGGHLTSTDIEIWAQDFGPHDVNTKDLEIIIWASQYPRRLENLEERKGRIINEIRNIRDAVGCFFTGFVYVLLQPASFGEI